MKRAKKNLMTVVFNPLPLFSLWDHKTSRRHFHDTARHEPLTIRKMMMMMLMDRRKNALKVPH